MSMILVQEIQEREKPMISPSLPISIRSAMIIILASALLYSATGCFDKTYEDDLSANQPPTVRLVSGPPEGAETNYRIHFYWHGFDKDGDVLYFEYAITDNEGGAFDPADTTGRQNWTKTTEYDREFVFSADEIADTNSTDMLTKFQHSHTFFVRAVDDKGLASPRPAYRSFTATTLSPTVDITEPAYPGPSNPAPVSLIANFQWTATDYIDNTLNTQDPDSIRWILLSVEDFSGDPEATVAYLRTHPDAPEWTGWYDYHGPNGQSWTSTPLDHGTYIFAVQALDEAGAVTPVFDLERNVRWLLPVSDGWPLLTLKNEFLPVLRSNVLDQRCWIVTLPAGLDLVFEWSGSADSYGSTITGYRYGWDVADPSRDEDWSTDWTSFLDTWASTPPQTYYSGTHTFRVEIQDNNGFTSGICLSMNFIPVSMDKPLLVVDDFAEPASIWNSFLTDELHDGFWKDMAQDAAGFMPDVDMVEVSRQLPLDLTQLVHYKSVIWNVLGGHELPLENRPLLGDCIGFVPEDPEWPFETVLRPDLLALYMTAGGHVLICGEQPMTTAVNPDYLTGEKYPLIFQYELAGDQDGAYDDQLLDPSGDRSFPFREMCLDVLDLAYSGQGRLRTGANGCDATALRGIRPREDGLRDCLPEDPDFPSLSLRPEFTAAGALYDSAASGLQSELYNPAYFACGQLDLGPRPCFEPIYGLGCLDPASPLYASPVAVWTSVYENVTPDAPGAVAARSALWGFEPFFFDTTAVRSALEVILFDEWQLERR
jgi:hypothetical protein